MDIEPERLMERIERLMERLNWAKGKLPWDLRTPHAPKPLVY